MVAVLGLRRFPVQPQTDAAMTDELARALAFVSRLTDDDLLALHKEVCRRAERVYRPLYAAKQDANYKAASALLRTAR